MGLGRPTGAADRGAFADICALGLPAKTKRRALDVEAAAVAIGQWLVDTDGQSGNHLSIDVVACTRLACTKGYQRPPGDLRIFDVPGRFGVSPAATSIMSLLR